MRIGDATVMPTLAATDLAAARRFYGGLLGLEEIELDREEAGALYRTGAGSYLFVYERPTPSGSTATACAFAVENIEKTVEQLRQQGVRFEEYDIPELGIRTRNGIASMDGYKTAWFKDPSGNILALEDGMQLELRRDRGRGAGAHP